MGAASARVGNEVMSLKSLKSFFGLYVAGNGDTPLPGKGSGTDGKGLGRDPGSGDTTPGRNLQRAGLSSASERTNSKRFLGPINDWGTRQSHVPGVG